MKKEYAESRAYSFFIIKEIIKFYDIFNIAEGCKINAFRIKVKLYQLNNGR